METDNRNLIIKGLALILIAILALNTYRTEQTRRELVSLTETVDQIQNQIDSLLVPADDPAAKVTTDNKKQGSLEKKVSNLESKINTIQKTVDQLSKNQNKTLTKPSSSSTASSVKTPSVSTSSNNNVRVSVSAKAKVENRYVSGTTYVPRVATGPTGTVIINVTITRGGTVTNVSLNQDSTISDEDIVDLCKECALKTSFSYNPEAQDKTKGNITYTFTAR